MASMDAEGYVNIVGRLKDMVIRGGENIYPREIEDILYQHPKVETVQAFGVPDPKFGEQLCVWIRLRSGELASVEEIRAFCSQCLAVQRLLLDTRRLGCEA
jgi:fatty-acyl-CoA synthase